jgi:hypothetical protein
MRTKTDETLIVAPDNTAQIVLTLTTIASHRRSSDNTDKTSR